MRHVVRKVGATLGCLSLELRGKTNIGPQMMVWKGWSPEQAWREERGGHLGKFGEGENSELSTFLFLFFFLRNFFSPKC